MSNTNAAINAVTTNDTATQLETRRNSWLAAGLSLQDVAILLSAEAKKANKAARHANVTDVMPRQRFAQKAKAMTVQISDLGLTSQLLVHAANLDKSYGWNLSEKVTVTIDGVQLPCQLGINLTVIGSKPVR